MNLLILGYFNHLFSLLNYHEKYGFNVITGIESGTVIVRKKDPTVLALTD